MNIKLVLSTYSKLRQLTDDETALLETLRRMTDTERELLVETLSPQKQAGKKTARKPAPEHCVTRGAPQRDPSHKLGSPDYHQYLASSKSSSKSPRAQSLSGAIQRRAKMRASDDNDGSDPSHLPQYCLAMVDDNGGEIACGKTADENIHHLRTNPDYHEFVSGKFSASTAERPSSANGGGVSGGQSSGTQPDSVSSVAREASGGT